jgi:hypothetical protein
MERIKYTGLYARRVDRETCHIRLGGERQKNNVNEKTL